MNSEQIQLQVESWANSKDFNAPYGVLTGLFSSARGKPYRSVTFGRARVLDVSVEIYNRNFIVVRTSRHGRQNFKSVADMQQFLETL